MKLLENPWVVGVLAVAAVGVVGYQLFPQFRPKRAPQVAEPPPTVPTPKPSAPAAGTPSSAKTSAAPEMGIDRSYFQSKSPTYVEAPPRDPFQLVSTPGVAAAASPVQQWQLKAIWRQGENRLAAINKGIYSEGDQIEGYRLERIEDGQVWFQGGGGRERLGFELGKPAAPTKVQ